MMEGLAGTCWKGVRRKACHWRATGVPGRTGVGVLMDLGRSVIGDWAVQKKGKWFDEVSQVVALRAAITDADIMGTNVEGSKAAGEGGLV